MLDKQLIIKQKTEADIAENEKPQPVERKPDYQRSVSGIRI